MTLDQIIAADHAAHKIAAMLKRDAKGRPADATYTPPLTTADVQALEHILAALIETQAGSGQLDYADQPRGWKRASKADAAGLDLTGYETRLGKGELLIRHKQPWEAEPPLHTIAQAKPE